jgi:hypothetical protein
MPHAQRSRTFVPLLLGASLLALALPLRTPLANACGAFFQARAIAPELRPTLAREKVLIIHDAARGQQHFIREVAFRQADESFGFVVPTPTRPVVAKVEHNPFTKLRERFPFKPVPRSTIGTGRAYGGASGSWEGVEVLSGWLQENQLTSTPETQQWLDHYVRMGFYYVAMRYDPPASGNSDAVAGIAAETIRVSFASPIAYYPYFEPERGRVDSSPRLLELWYVGTDPVNPVARVEEHTGARGWSVAWERPLMPGKDYGESRKRVEAALDDELEQLLPEGELVVQTFQDQKRQRNGYHDILFAFAQPKQLTTEQLTALEPLLGVLDPGLIEERP